MPPDAAARRAPRSTPFTPFTPSAGPIAPRRTRGRTPPGASPPAAPPAALPAGRTRRPAARLESHPDPPADLDTRSLPLLEVPGPWVRIYQLAHEPLFFGRTGRYRFDAPRGEYGVLYAAADAHGAFVETFGWRTGHAGDRLIGMDKLRVRGLARITAARSLRLVDLAGEGLARLGADARLGAGDSYVRARRWALALWRHPEQPDGLLYRTRHDPSRHAVALFDRVAALLAADPLGSLAAPSLAALLADVLATYEFGLAVDPPPHA